VFLLSCENTVATTIVADKSSLILDRRLQYDHPTGSAVARILAE